jgi:hypothetical protein
MQRMAAAKLTTETLLGDIADGGLSLRGRTVATMRLTCAV